MKTLFYTFGLLVLAFLFGADALAQGALIVEPLTSIGTEAGNQAGIGPFVNLLYKYGVGIGAILAVLLVMYGGFQYMTSEAVGNKSEGRETITRALIGLFLLLSPVLVFGVINRDILNIDLDFGRLNYGGGVIDDGRGNTQTAPSFCQDYSNFRKVELGLSQSCQEVIGDGWRRIDSQCCAAANATGSGSCCGFDEDLIPPEPVELGEFTVSYIFGENLTTPSLACKESGSRDFETLAECEVEDGLLQGDGAAIEITCDGTVHTPAIPAANWAPLADLPWCSN